MTSQLYQNSGQTFKTTITEEQDESVVIDASDFTEAIYRIYNQDCTAVLVEKKLSLSEIAVVADGVNNIFQTTLLKTDMNMAANSYPHQFKVTNSAGLELPPVFENTVTIAEVCD